MEGRKGKRKRQILFLMLAETVLLVILTIIILNRNSMVINASITDWGSNYIDFDNGWYVDESIVETKDTIDIICGPYIDLKEGIYSVNVEYECDYDQNFLAFANAGNDVYLKADLKKLRSNQQSASYNFVLTREIDNLEIVVKYNGRGALLVKNIEIKPDTTSLWKNVAIVLYFCVMIDLCVLFYSKRKWPQIILLLEAGAMFFLLGAIIVLHNEKDTSIDTSITDWKSEYIEYNDGWYIDESIVQADDRIENGSTFNLIYGPYIALEKGTYTVKVDYECDENQRCRAFTNYVAGAYIKTGENNILSRNQTSASFDLTVTEDIENLEVNVQYNGQGSLKVKNIEIHRNTVGLQRMLAIAVLLSLCIDICFYFKKYIKANKFLILKLCGIILLVSCQLFVRGMGTGHDINFHLMRIEGLAEELRRGIFPVKMSSLWMDGYGYPVSIFYGDILLYIPAALRIIGFTVVTAYKSYIFLVNAGTVIISYICFKKIFKNEEAAFLASFAYTTATYRIVCVYVRAAVGEYSAMMFLPLIALAVYQFYTLDSSDWKPHKRYALVLALGMTGLIGSHILSTEMTVVTLALLCVILWKTTFKKYVFRGYVLAVIETIALSSYFLIPFLDYYRNVEVNINYAPDGIQAIQRTGAYIVQYFSSFQNLYSTSGIERTNLTPGLPLMAALVAAIALWAKGKATKEIKIYLSFSVFLLFMASNLFPWDYIGLRYQWGKILSAVQFPWRYIGIAVIFMTMLLGSVYNWLEKEGGFRKEFYTATIGACVLISVLYISNYTNYSWWMNFYDTPEISTYSYVFGEYLRPWTDTESFTGEIAYENMQMMSLLARDGTYMELYCETSETDGTVDLPMLNYKGYQIIDEHGNRYEITDGPNNVIQFSVPAGFAGKITVDFVEPWYWRLGEAVSLIAIIAICVKNVLRACKVFHHKKKSI